MTRLPGLVFLYNRVLKPLLFPPTLEDGLAKVSYPSFIMYVDPKHTPGEDGARDKLLAALLTTSLFRRVIRPVTLSSTWVHIGDILLFLPLPFAKTPGGFMLLSLTQRISPC